MIQDIYPHIFYNPYRPCPPKPDSYVLVFAEKKVLCSRKDGKIDFPRFADLAEEFPNITDRWVYLFTVDDRGFYLLRDVPFRSAKKADSRRPYVPRHDAHVSAQETPGECSGLAARGFAMESTQVFRRGEPKHLAFAGITAYQLWGWYRSRRFCGRCGSRMVHDEKERMMRCPTCGNMEFPKICPAVIIGVTDGSRILMSRYAGRSYKSYALLAGFTEIGETVEQTVHREVMEEVGLRVKNLRYYKSQPWPFSDTLLMGFYCDLDGDAQITLDREELSTAEWVERSDITVTPTDDSLTNEMIVTFKNGEV